MEMFIKLIKCVVFSSWSLEQLKFVPRDRYDPHLQPGTSGKLHSGLAVGINAFVLALRYRCRCTTLLPNSASHVSLHTHKKKKKKKKKKATGKVGISAVC